MHAQKQSAVKERATTMQNGLFERSCEIQGDSQE